MSYSNKIRFNTSRFGLLEIDEGKIIHFPDGLLGFPGLSRYMMLDHKETPVKWLQALDDPDIAFIVADPGVLSPTFVPTIDSATKKYLDLQDDDMDSLVVLVIIRVENEKVIANFSGPLFLNASNMRGVQVVLDKVRDFKDNRDR
ncbi:MAG: flagellar assembly protein FliW [Nitrospirae bacterium]|nr:flagellar assembly protein FliW [Nitrospirota bacterium]